MRADWNYRKDIDGLRALAIIPVLLFHARVAGFSGGYVGVDIFFVISGFLITGIIAREMERGDFSILRFYERRARRIMPALTAVTLVTLALSYRWFLADDFMGAARSAIAATFFCANILFFHEKGYFDTDAYSKPFLHSWSLGVEEQFYILFPVLLIAIHHIMPKWRTAIIICIAVCSFILALRTQSQDDGYAFYLLFPRAWELMAGASLALGIIPAIRHPQLREAFAITGLALIGWAIFTFSPETVFPGASALFPVLGAMALIHTAPGTRTGRLLSLPPLVGMGLISYSLYLWHWPLIVFVEYGQDHKLSGWSSVGVIVASVVLAILSWRYVERPFRNPIHFDRRKIFRLSAAAMAVSTLVAAYVVNQNGIADRFDGDIRVLAEGKNDISPYREKCHESGTTNRPQPCALGAKNTVPNTLFWGDSHGVELAYIFSQTLEKSGGALLQHTYSACPPIFDENLPDPRCKEIGRRVLAEIKRDDHIRTVYLAGYWSAYHRPGMAKWLDNTIAALTAMDRKVVLIGPVPTYDYDVPARLVTLANKGALMQAHGVERTSIVKGAEWMQPVIARWSARGLIYIDPAAYLCGPRYCDIVRDGKPLYFDTNHISVSGARIIFPNAE